MSGRVPVEHSDVQAIRGPLVIVRGVSGVGWDEVAEVRAENGDVRHGVVLDVHGDVAVVEVLEGTHGLALDRVGVAFAGSPMRVDVGEEWLGRVCDGRGEPLDGGPPVMTGDARDVAGRPLNPVARAVPSDPILTGVSAIDALALLVCGQKLPIFSAGGLPHLELAAQVAAQARASGGEAFAVVVAAIGLPHADVAVVADALEGRLSRGELTLVVNTADDPLVERLLTPRIALTVAEHLAFERGRHVLVVMADITSYCEAVREVSAARGEVPSRRGYPGYLYSDLASIYERAGRIAGRPGSLTQVPVLTMPGGDVTHPVPDLTGYITEGQLVLSPTMAARGVYPPLDLLGSLSRLMRLGAGPGRTRDDHLAVAAQLYALAAAASRAEELAEVVGVDALSPDERRLLGFRRALEDRMLSQRRDERRSLGETLERAWQALGTLPRRELTMIGEETLAARYPGRAEADARAAG
jgi:V/A-type H+-transporting ATPase subunit B